MVAIPRQNLGWTLFGFSLLCLLFWVRWGYAPVAAEGMVQSDMPLGRLLHQFSLQFPLWSHGATIGVIFWNSVLLIRIISRNMILTDRSYLPMIVYLWIIGGCYLGSGSLETAVTSLILISAFGRMLNSFRRVVQYGSLFNSALLTGIALLIWSHTIVYVPLLGVALILFKKESREWIVALAGVILPLLICSYVYWGMGKPFDLLFVELRDGVQEAFLSEGFIRSLPSIPLLVFWGGMVLTLGFSCVTFWQRADTLRTRAYKSYLYFLWILLFSALPMIAPGRSWLDFSLLAAPLSILIPSYLKRSFGWIPNLLYLLLGGSIILYNLLPLLYP
ncbi:MAG: hypothetical protein PHV49_04860 [Alistipes sp.]|nr:hypothetical protein [Alistipes sp.]